MDVDFFDPIDLDHMDQVKLMNRTDRKFWFHIDHLQLILDSVANSYYALSIEGQRFLPYTSTYYDTTSNKMYSTHHNGKLERHKIRRRSYVSSELSFLEIKHKSNKGRTIKKRIQTEFNNSAFTLKEFEFVSENSPFSCRDLLPSLINEFSRLTLVNKNFSERCTIDINLQYTKGKKTVALDNLVIVEIKSDGKQSFSPLAMSLRDHRIFNSGFSKYCIGRALTDNRIKTNAFRKKLRRLEKTINTSLKY